MEHIEIEQVRSNDGRIYSVAVISLSLISFAIQMIANWYIPFDIRSEVPPILGTGLSVVGSSPSYFLRPGSAVAWRGRVWVSASPSTVSGVIPRGIGVPPSQLFTIDPASGIVHDSKISLSPGPVGLVVVDDELFAVANSVVYRIDANQAIPRSPRRGLVHPSAPFVYQGQLAVIDKNLDDEYELLTWDNGEWDVAAQVEIPSLVTNTTRWGPDYSELRIVTAQEKTFVLLTDWNMTLQREGLVAGPVQDAVSALRPVNQRPVYDDAKVTNSIQTSISSKQFQGWESLPSGFHAVIPFQTMFIGEHLWAAGILAPNSGLIVYRFENDSWILKKLDPSVVLTSFSVVNGPANYLVTDNLRLFAFDNPTNPRLIRQPSIIGQQSRHAMLLSAWFMRHVLSAALLSMSVWWFMKRYRPTQYAYGHRQVVFASLLRRGFARAIDTVILVYPSYIWFSRASKVDSRTLAAVSERGAADAIVMLFFGVFGVWVTSIIAISVVEGIWGVTPGKWLCGIRTMRTTLRPCGLVRALARELLVYVDSMFLVAWQPGIMLIGLTRRWQRLGDLAADTVVVLNPDQSKWHS